MPDQTPPSHPCILRHEYDTTVPALTRDVAETLKIVKGWQDALDEAKMSVLRATWTALKWGALVTVALVVYTLEPRAAGWVKKVKELIGG